MVVTVVPAIGGEPWVAPAGLESVVDPMDTLAQLSRGGATS